MAESRLVAQTPTLGENATPGPALARELGPASRIGRYQLVSPIGAGGMGRVWVALDTAAPALRLVALKTTLASSESGMGADFWAMLSDEAALASRINHPNVCATFELGQQAATHYLVMEWSDGASLRDVLDATRGRRIEPELAAFIGASVAAGLHAAHELTDDDGHLLGVVHRDVSPQNVLVSMRGHVRLADFGVAKARGQQHRPTETGEVKGKLSYMAPEQVASKAIDRRADVFALGCVLYEASLGHRPFHGADALATMYQILEKDLVLPSALDPTFPQQLQQVLVRALAKDPNARYQSAEEFRQALVDYLSSTGRFFTDKHVAGVLGEALGAQLRERNRAIFASAEQLRRGETDPARLDSPPPPAPTQTLTPEGGIERSVTMGKRSRSWHPTSLLLATAALTTLALIGGWKVLSQESTKPRSEATVAAPAVPAPIPVASGASAAPALPPTPSTSPAATAASASAPKTLRGSRGVTRTSPPPAATPATTTSVHKPPAKKPRPIDHDNPFAKP